VGLDVCGGLESGLWVVCAARSGGQSIVKRCATSNGRRPVSVDASLFLLHL
jgi:hypothetical protein